MIKFVILLKRKEGMSREEFFKHWINDHAPVAKKLPGLRKYVINTSERSKDEYDGLSELWFDDEDALRRAFASPQGEAATKDGDRFIGSRVRLVTKEHVILE